MVDYIPDFDYGGAIAEKEDHFKLWPTGGRMTALVDADLLPYQVGYTTDPLREMQARGLVEDGAYSTVSETPQFLDAFDKMCSTLNGWVRNAGCDSAILYCTNSASNFRLDIAFTHPYKGQRNPDKPPFFYELKQAMIDKLFCKESCGNEADDELSIEAMSRANLLEAQGIAIGSRMHKELCDSVTISTDKDAGITPTLHYDPVKRTKHFSTKIGELIPYYKTHSVKKYEYVGTGEFWKRGDKAGQEKTKRVYVGDAQSSALKDLKGNGLKFFYAQILMGDAADNYHGLPNCGMTGAYELLNNCNSEQELYYTVLEAYKKHYGTKPFRAENYRGGWAMLTAYDMMLEQGRLAWMQQKPNEIWRADKGRIISGTDKEFWNDTTD